MNREAALKKLLRGVFIPLLLGCLAYPQRSADADKPTKEQVQEFLDLMQSRQMMAQLVEGMRAAQKVGFEETFKRLVPNARPELLQKVDSLTDEAFLDFPVQEMLDAIIPIYQRHLTKTDFDGIIRFYKSPIGQKFLKERPAMVQESMQAGQAIMLQKLPDLLDRLKTNVAKLADDERKLNPSPVAEVAGDIPGVPPGSVPGGVAGGTSQGQTPGVIGGIVSSGPMAGRILVSTRVSEGLLTKKVEPTYPPLARQARIQGTVLLQAYISKDGTIENLQLISGHPMLVPAAIDAVKQWVYHPYVLNNRPVDVETQIQVNFTLSNN
jgi:TonB family protein